MNVQRRYGKISFLISLLIFVSAAQVCAQSNYADFPDSKKDPILFERFDAGFKWPLPQGKLENGSLVLSDRLNMINPKTAASIHIDDKQDFEIELMASSTSTVLPGRLHWNNYCWELAAGAASVVYFNESNIKYISRAPVKNEFNKYTIRKAGTTIYYFIDEKMIGTTVYYKPEMQGQLLIGFSGKINVNNLKVSYLLKEELAMVSKPDDNTSRNNNSIDNNTQKTPEIMPGGKFYALIIGVSKYNEPKLYLENPEKDAVRIKNIFIARYSFTDSTTLLLLNPTRQKILAELYRLRKIIGPNDNLVIFYAGHGYWDKDAKQGYWWAKDAMHDDPSTWLSNGDLREQIRSIRSAHTLLISDACFSGGIFRTRSGEELMNASKDIQILYKMPSRRAITSGTMTAVPDNSVFMEYFLKRLNDNQVKFISSQQLFDSFRSAVINNSSVVPQDGVIAETGDEGGDFIFILKDN